MTGTSTPDSTDRRSGTGSRTVTRVLMLALVSIAGIVGMLLAQAPLWDALLIALAAAPLIFGLWRWRAGRRR